MHVHGGFLVKIAEEVAYQVDLHRGEVLHWVTDLGWIMGPWEIVGALALGATVLLFDGAPTYPAPDRLWSLVERHGVTTLGVSPTLIRALIPSRDRPRRARTTCRRSGSSPRPASPGTPTPTGGSSTRSAAAACPIINLSGGTEVGACFLSPLPICALKPCTLRGPALGMDVDVVDDDGAPVGAGRGGRARLPPALAGDDAGDLGRPRAVPRHLLARFPGVWVHGDWASRDADGYWFLHGRSDDTLSVAGQAARTRRGRGGAAGAPGRGGVAPPSASRPRQGRGDLVLRGAQARPGRGGRRAPRLVADQLGASFAPARIVFVPELPKTRSAKVVRRAIRAAAIGEDPGDLSGLENPRALDAVREAVGR